MEGTVLGTVGDAEIAPSLAGTQGVWLGVKSNPTIKGSWGQTLGGLECQTDDRESEAKC